MGWGSRWNKKEKGHWAATFVWLRFLTADEVWPVASCSCRRPDWTCHDRFYPQTVSSNKLFLLEVAFIRYVVTTMVKVTNMIHAWNIQTIEDGMELSLLSMQMIQSTSPSLKSKAHSLFDNCCMCPRRTVSRLTSLSCLHLWLSLPLWVLAPLVFSRTLNNTEFHHPAQKCIGLLLRNEGWQTLRSTMKWLAEGWGRGCWVNTVSKALTRISTSYLGSFCALVHCNSGS